MKILHDPSGAVFMARLETAGVRRVDFWGAVLSWVLVAAVLVWAGASYDAAYWQHPAVARSPAFPEWWGWADQGRYHRAAQAWASLSLDPARHWYFEGYPLLGAIFDRFSPGHPFYWVDLGCLLAVGALLARLGERLIPPAPLGRAVGTLAFAVAVVLPGLAMKGFVEPWTTTPTAPVALGSLLLAFMLWERPSGRRAAVLGLVAGSTVLFRPTDVLPLAAAIGVGTAGVLRGRAWRLVGPAAAGVAVPAALTAATYLAVFGWHRSPYLLQSAQTGFEWRLIAMRWVTVFVSSRPAYPEENSLAQTFPWVIAGVAGMAAALVASRGELRWRHAVVVGAAALHCALYLAYRDLHLQGLFRFGNYNYFKWCLPVLALYAGRLALAAARREWGAAAAGIGVALFLFSWRMAWREVPAPWLASSRLLDAHTLAVPRAPGRVDEALMIPASGGFGPIYLVGAEMHVGERLYAANEDTKAIPLEGGLLFTVLRPIAAGAAVIRFDDDVWLGPGKPRLERARLFWRWPHPFGAVWYYHQRWFGVQE